MGGGGGDQVQQTPQQKALLEYGVKKYADYQTRWAPTIRHMASVIEANHEPNSAARALTEGKAATDTKIAFAQARNKADAKLAGTGASPLATTGMGDDMGKALGLSAVVNDQQAEDAYISGLNTLTALGRGEKASFEGGLQQQAARSAVQAQADAQASLDERAGNAQLVGQVAGFGMGIKGSGGGGSAWDRGELSATGADILARK